jgi:hypothetical protein
LHIKSGRLLLSLKVVRLLGCYVVRLLGFEAPEPNNLTANNLATSFDEFSCTGPHVLEPPRPL